MTDTSNQLFKNPFQLKSEFQKTGNITYNILAGTWDITSEHSLLQIWHNFYDFYFSELTS